MKNTIETPKGCKIAKTEIIDGNLIVTYERDLPDSVKEIPNRNWFIHSCGTVENKKCIAGKSTNYKSNFSTKERAEAILALGQLLELAAYVGCDNVNVEFQFGLGKSGLALEFKEKYSELFEKTKKLL